MRTLRCLNPTVREILAEASTVRPEPFGSELKAELLTAEGGYR